MDRTALPPGARLGELEIVRVLAVGGFGIVYQARDHSLDRDVAVKEFMPTPLAGRGLGQRVSVRIAADAHTYMLGLQSFIDEAKLLARLSHPAIVKVYRFWKGNGTGYMVMPYLRGPTLGDVRRSMSEPPTEAWLRRMTDPLLDALDVLHAEGFYHRDIAPDNVLVADNGLPVLLDFGAARRVIANRTQSVTAIVKPHFAPIEQYAEGRLLRQGPWTDLYALGALVTYLLDGKPPPPSTARAVDDEMAPLALRQIPGVSSGFLAAIDWALAVRPQDRPQNVAELRAALGSLSAPSAPRRRAGSQPPPDDAGFATPLQLVRPFVPQRAPEPITRHSSNPPANAASALHNASMRRRGWAAAGAMLAAAAMLLVVTKLPFESVAANAPTVASAQGIAPSAAAAPKQMPTPTSPDATIAHGSPVEEFTDGRPEVIIESAAAPSELNPALAPIATRAMRVAAASVKPNADTRRIADRKFASARPRTLGPSELCASRNFFIRPWCVQRRCTEARFKGSAQCKPHQLARSDF